MSEGFEGFYRRDICDFRGDRTRDANGGAARTRVANLAAQASLADINKAPVRARAGRVMSVLGTRMVALRRK